MAGRDGGAGTCPVRRTGRVWALAAIDEALEQPVTARTDRQQRWQLNQLRGLLLTLPSNGLSLEDSLRQLIRLLRAPMVDR